MNSNIRFKGYVLEHNPETLVISSRKNLSDQKTVGAKNIIRETGDNSRVVTGEGKIHGADCIYKFMKLFKLKEESDSAVLSIPGVKPFYAFFSSLEFSADPTPELISYKFVFREDCSEHGTMLIPEKYYAAAEGKDLWDIAYKFDVPVETLIELNPDIMRANELEEGCMVKIC